MNIFNFSNYIISNYSTDYTDITPMKLQKLLYYLKVWGLISEVNLIPEKFIHMKYGPVNLAVYEKYKKYGASPVPISGDSKTSDFSINPKTRELVDFIVENYIDFHALVLSAMTHAEKPWQQTSLNEEIKDSDIVAYYKTLSFAKNFPLDKNRPFYPVMADINHAFILDMNEKDSKSFIFDSYDEYKKMKENTKNIGAFINKAGKPI